MNKDVKYQNKRGKISRVVYRTISELYRAEIIICSSINLGESLKIKER